MNFMNMLKFLKIIMEHLKKNVDQILKKNDVLFDIDWQGTKQLSNFKNLNLVKIYLITDTKSELKRRLLKRDQNTKEEVEKDLNL